MRRGGGWPGRRGKRRIAHAPYHSPGSFRSPPHTFREVPHPLVDVRLPMRMFPPGYSGPMLGWGQEGGGAVPGRGEGGAGTINNPLLCVLHVCAEQTWRERCTSGCQERACEEGGGGRGGGLAGRGGHCAPACPEPHMHELRMGGGTDACRGRTGAWEGGRERGRVVRRVMTA